MAGSSYNITLQGKNKTDAAFNKVKGNVNSLSGSMKKLGGIIAGAFAVGSIIAFGKHTLELADTIGKVADSIGVSTEFLQKFQFAAQQSGLTTEEFNKGMQNFTKMVGQATIRTSEDGRTLEKLGVNVKNVDGSIKSTEEVFMDLTGALDNVGSEFEKNAILADLMGRAGVKLGVMLKEGSDSMKELAESATGVLDEETIRRAERFNDTMNLLKREILAPIQTLFINVANSVLLFLDSINLIEVPKTMEELQEELREAERLQTNFNKAQENTKKANKNTFQDQTAKIALLKQEIGTLKELEEKRAEIEKAAATALGEATSRAKAITNVASTMTAGFTEFFDFTKQGFMDFGNLAKKILTSIINEFIKVFIIKKLLTGAGNLFGGSLGEVFTKAADSFEGGGFTGMGNRAGGLDGRGGFMAMVHPNETIVDHTKGQTLGGATVNFNINTVDAAGFDQLLVQRKGTITQIINNAMNNQGKMGIV